MSPPWWTGPKWFSQRASAPVTSTWNVDSAAIGKSKVVWFVLSLQAALLIDLCLGFWGFGFPNDSPVVLFLFDQKECTLGMILYAVSAYLCVAETFPDTLKYRSVYTKYQPGTPQEAQQAQWALVSYIYQRFCLKYMMMLLGNHFSCLRWFWVQMLQNN